MTTRISRSVNPWMVCDQPWATDDGRLYDQEFVWQCELIKFTGSKNCILN